MNLPIPKGVIYIVLAGMVGLVATFTIHRYVSMKTEVPKVAQGQVAIAVADLSPGLAIAAGAVKIVSWPKELIPPATASTLKEVENRVALVPIAKGEPILVTKLAPEGTAAGLGGLLDGSKRALSVRVDDVSGVSGFVHPRDHVDVLMDLPMPGSKEEHISKTILQNLVVMSTGQIWEQKGDQKPMVVNTVTLEVSPDQAEILNLASNQGKIRLSLRNRTNVAAIHTPGVTTSAVIGVRAGTKNPGQERSVEVIKGLERTKAAL
jgi:pilus assembly protein CpaB